MNKIDLDTRKYTVKEIRFLMGELTQEEFGNLIGLSKLQIWSRENAETEWSMREIALISDVSGVPLDRTMSSDRSDLRKIWRTYIRELKKDPTYEIRKAQFLAQKKERATLRSVPLQDEDKNKSYPPNFTKLEDENDTE